MVTTDGGFLTGHIVVTGGASGIGEGIVRNALARGASVSFVDINKDVGEALAQELTNDLAPGQHVFFDVCDVTDFEQIQTSMTKAVKVGGSVTGLVNNAGRNSYADPVEMTEEEWDEFFDLDLKSTWLMCKAVLPMMREARKGSIVNIASIHAHMTYPNYFPYAAAKSGLLGLTRNLALDEGRFGIRVNTVSPGYTLTPLLLSWFDQEPEARDNALAVHPMGYFAEPNDIANVVNFLLSDQARFVTGADWRVDGGLSARFAT